MSKFSSFLNKFVPEYRALANALGTIIIGVALDPKDRDQLQETINTVKKAADNIENSIKSVEKAEAVGIDPKVLADAVKKEVAKALPDAIGGLTETALRAALEKKEKRN